MQEIRQEEIEKIKNTDVGGLEMKQRIVEREHDKEVVQLGDKQRTMFSFHKLFISIHYQKLTNTLSITIYIYPKMTICLGLIL